MTIGMSNALVIESAFEQTKRYVAVAVAVASRRLVGGLAK
jgi:hypothetical protein